MRCPICNANFDPDPTSKSLPFCSPRCQQIDLGRWLGEAYSMPLDPTDELDESTADDISCENN